MLEKSCSSVFEIPLLNVSLNLPLFVNFQGTEIPNANMGAIRALKRAATEGKRAQHTSASIGAVASSSNTSPLDLS